MENKNDINLSITEEQKNSILNLEESKQSFPDLTPITETSDEESDDDSMPELIYCTGCSDCCCNFGIENKNIQLEQPIDYNDEEIEKREERYENWKENRSRTLKPEVISPLFEEKR